MGGDHSIGHLDWSNVPGGVSSNMLADMLEALSRKGEIACFDLVEVAPQYDHSEATTRIAALIMLYFMGVIQKRRETVR